jgi:hypothetical protein
MKNAIASPIISTRQRNSNSKLLKVVEVELLDKVEDFLLEKEYNADDLQHMSSLFQRLKNGIVQDFLVNIGIEAIIVRIVKARKTL